MTTTEPFDAVAESPGPEQTALEGERVAFARKLFASLAQGDREVIEFRFWADLSYREVGTVMHISEGAARVRVHRALRKLKALLEIQR